jgi:hypothetical protein
MASDDDDLTIEDSGRVASVSGDDNAANESGGTLEKEILSVGSSFPLLTVRREEPAFSQRKMKGHEPSARRETERACDRKVKTGEGAAEWATESVYDYSAATNARRAAKQDKE